MEIGLNVLVATVAPPSLARGVGWAPDVTLSVWRMRQQGAWWHSLSYSFRYVVPQFHLPTINSISVTIHLQGQPSSETPCTIQQLTYVALYTFPVVSCFFKKSCNLPSKVPASSHQPCIIFCPHRI